VYCLADPDGTPFHLLVVNASNRPKILNWIESHRRAKDGVRLEDQTMDTVMISIQGPHALSCLASRITVPLAEMDYYSGLVTDIAGHSAIISRTGYTGEDGFELIVPAGVGVTVWEQALRDGARSGARPVGLGARDTLRLEAAMPLYGHELSEQIDPYQAGLGFAVQLNHEFEGRAALSQLKGTPPQLIRIGLELAGKRVPREHYSVLSANAVVGEVSSGTFSPTLEKPIAMAYVRPEHSTPGTEVAVDIRGKQEPARVVSLPFYSRPRS
jgi:aminomethyltransferase